MTKQRQPVGKWLRRFVLMSWAGVFLSNLSRVLSDEDTTSRVISAVLMAVCAGLFVYWWRAPVADDKASKRSDQR